MSSVATYHWFPNPSSTPPFRSLFVEIVNLHATCAAVQPNSEMSLESMSA